MNILLWLVMVALVYTAYTYFMGYGSLKAVYSSFLPLAHNRWWFITAYISLYLLSPFINAAMEALNTKQILLVIVVMYSILLYRMIGLVSNAGSDIIGILFVYIMARLMAINKVVVRMNVAVCLLASCALALTILLCGVFYGTGAFFPPEMTQRLTFQLFSYCNPLIVTMAVALFYIVYNMPARTNKYLNTLLRSSLFIYLFTQGVGFINYKELAAMFIQYPVKYIAWFALIVVASMLAGQVIMLSSKIIVKSIELILTPIYRRLSIMITSVFKA